MSTQCGSCQKLTWHNNPKAIFFFGKIICGECAENYTPKELEERIGVTRSGETKWTSTGKGTGAS